jgi:hypothetical protein
MNQYGRTQVTIKLTAEEYSALAAMAKADCRNVRQEVRAIMIEEARRRGLLAASPWQSPGTQQPEGEE